MAITARSRVHTVPAMESNIIWRADWSIIVLSTRPMLRWACGVSTYSWVLAVQSTLYGTKGDITTVRAESLQFKQETKMLLETGTMFVIIAEDSPS